MPFFGLWLSVVLLTILATALTDPDPMRVVGITLGGLVLIAVVVAIRRKVSDN